MKRCPECRRDYHDETLLYCLEDGTALIQGAVAPSTISETDEQATAILRVTETPAPFTDTSTDGTPVDPGRPRRKPFKREHMPWITTSLLLVVIAVFAWMYYSQRPSNPGSGKFSFNIEAPQNTSVLLTGAVSPDGKMVAVQSLIEGKPQIFLRPLNSTKYQPLTDSLGTSGPHFWSPDSRYVCVYTNGKLKKFAIADGTSQVVANVQGTNAPGDVMGNWGSDGTILFGSQGKIYRTSGSGTTEPILVVAPDPSREELALFSPVILPGGRHFVYHVESSADAVAGLYTAALDGSDPRRLVASDSQAEYADTKGGKYLLYVREEALYAHPFDPSSRQLTGDPLRLVDRVRRSTSPPRATFSVSNDGILVYFSNAENGDRHQLTWIDRAGKVIEPIKGEGRYENPRLSPDGKRLAFTETPPGSPLGNVFVVDLERKTTSRLTFEGENDRVLWSPDSSHIAFVSRRAGKFQIIRKAANGVGEEELLTESSEVLRTDSWSADGKYLFFTSFGRSTNEDVWVIPLGGDRKPFVLVQTPFSESRARISPDGRWLCYQSNESGRTELHVISFPEPGSKIQVSNGMLSGSPVWRADGRELFYLSADGSMTSVDVNGSGAAFQAAVPKPLFGLTITGKVRGTGWSMSGDGQKFIFVTQASGEGVRPRYTVLTDWLAELKR